MEIRLYSTGFFYVLITIYYKLSSHDQCNAVIKIRDCDQMVLYLTQFAALQLYYDLQSWRSLRKKPHSCKYFLFVLKMFTRVFGLYLNPNSGFSVMNVDKIFVISIYISSNTKKTGGSAYFKDFVFRVQTLGKRK